MLVCLQSADDPTPVIAEGAWHGQIAKAPSGEGGFGYDPVFYLPDLKCTAAQLTPDEKHRLSHRGIALRVLQDRLVERYQG